MRLIESVKMVRELLKNNQDMREVMDKLNQKNEKNELELYHLGIENQELREKIEIMHNVLSQDI
jgi:hypothetical protein